ncbi:MAG: V-type ATP synthase subunit E [bacterium]|nr:V-type ATP synthase subunit E [bacterium]
MKLDVKLDHFYKSVIDDATTQSAKILEEYKEQLAKMYEDRKAEMLEHQALTIKNETDNVAREKNKQLSSEAINIRRQLSEKKDELKDSLFKDVTAKLDAFMKTSAYDELLVREIKSAKDFGKDEEIIIYINSSDASKKEMLEKKSGAQLTISTIDFKGGTRAVIHEKNILIDNSFVTKLAEEKENFQF